MRQLIGQWLANRITDPVSTITKIAPNWKFALSFCPALNFPTPARLVAKVL